MKNIKWIVTAGALFLCPAAGMAQGAMMVPPIDPGGGPCPVFSCSERLNPIIQQTEHKFTWQSPTMGDIHCNGTPTGHGTCHEDPEFDTCYSHGVCDPHLAIGDIEKAIDDRNYAFLTEGLRDANSGLQLVAGGVVLKSACSDAAFAGFPLDPEIAAKLGGRQQGPTLTALLRSAVVSFLV